MSWFLSDAGLVGGCALFMLAVAATRWLIVRQFKQPERPSPQWTDKGSREILSELEDWIGYLLRSGLNDAGLKVKFPAYNSELFVQKFIRSDGVYGVVLRLPDGSDSEYPLDALRRYSETEFITRHRADPTAHQKFRDWGQDVEKACQMLRAKLVDFANLPKNTEIEYEMVGNFRPFEVVDSLTQEPLSSEELDTVTQYRLAERLGIGYGELAILGLLRVMQGLGTWGICVGLLTGLIAPFTSVEPTWHTWSAEILGFSIIVRTFDVVVIGLVVAGSRLYWCRAYWINKLVWEGRDWRGINAPGWKLGTTHAIREAVRKMKFFYFLISLLVLLWFQNN